MAIKEAEQNHNFKRKQICFIPKNTKTGREISQLLYQYFKDLTPEEQMTSYIYTAARVYRYSGDNAYTSTLIFDDAGVTINIFRLNSDSSKCKFLNAYKTFTASDVSSSVWAYDVYFYKIVIE